MLNGLCILCIEKDIIEHIDIDAIISYIAYINDHKYCFVRAFEY